jgi:hypothetical protein
MNTFATLLFGLEFVCQLTILYIIFTQPGTFEFIENELRSFYNSEYIIFLVLVDVITIIYLLYFSYNNALTAHILNSGTFYLIKFCVLNEKT